MGLELLADGTNPCEECIQTIGHHVHQQVNVMVSRELDKNILGSGSVYWTSDSVNLGVDIYCK